MASWFCRHGFDVFLPVGTPSVDFVAVSSTRTDKVQVKTATWQPREKCYAVKLEPQKYTRVKPDVFVFVTSKNVTGTVIYAIPTAFIDGKKTLRLGGKYKEFTDFISVI